MPPRKKPTTPNKPFDVTTKTLIETNPLDWLAFLHLPAAACELVDSDLSTVSTQADRIIRVTAPAGFSVPFYAVHQELQASADFWFPYRLMRYNVLTYERLQILVHSVAVLLRPEADAYHNVTGTLVQPGIFGKPTHTFSYQVIRVWEIPVNEVLSSGLATLPLALISDLEGKEPDAVLGQMTARLEAEPISIEERRLLLTSAFLLSGLRYNQDTLQTLFRGVIDMKESAAYQLIVQEGLAQGLSQGIAQGLKQGLEQGLTQGLERGEIKGRLAEAQAMLLRIGAKRLGAPDQATVERVMALQSAEQVEALADVLFAVETWDELFAASATSP